MSVDGDMTDLALGVDIGTSGVRVAAVTRAGALLDSAATSLSAFGDDRRDPAVWRSALRQSMTELAERVDLRRIGAVAVDGTSGTVLALDADDRPIGGALMYNDAVDDAAILSSIAEAAPRESAAHGASSALARAILLQGRPGVVRIAHQADWIAEQFAGAPLGSDESNALKTGYDPIGRRWPDWLAQTPIRRELLPEITPCGARAGQTNGAFGLPIGAPVVAGVSDGCASFLATGAAEPGDGVTALGTTMTLKLLCDRPIFAPEFGVYSHRIGDLWLAGGASNSGGGALAAEFTPEEIETLSARIDPAQASGLDYYPLPKPGERFPINDPSLPPRMTPRAADDARHLHGLLEGVARIEALGYRRLQELGAPPLRRLRTVGGGAGNTTWSAIRARLIGADMAPSASTEAAVGVARLALRQMPEAG